MMRALLAMRVVLKILDLLAVTLKAVSPTG